ncbi:MAG: TatD family nuclease-associated radical SAM protein [Gammaproteobacteria bacterium]|nr:TatD family nuclease-associated radical SAM protein [Gammaproteobacteria bacterium]
MPDRISYPIGDRLYLNITDRCTLECTFCPKTLGRPQVHDYDLSLSHRPTVEEIVASIGDPGQYAEVVFCGFGEPTLRLKVLLEVARWVKARGGRVRVNTDGLANLVHKDDVLPLLGECVDALSVSLNAQDAEVYERVCQPGLPGSFEKMLGFLREAPRHVPDVTATAIRGLDGVDIPACERLAHALGVKFRARELDHVG